MEHRNSRLISIFIAMVNKMAKQSSFKTCAPRFLKNILYLFYTLIRYTRFVLLFGGLKKDIKQKKTDVLFTSELMDWRIINGELDDVRLGGVIKKIRKSFSVTVLDHGTGYAFRDYKKTVEKMEKMPEAICRERYMNFGMIFKSFILATGALIKGEEEESFGSVIGSIGRMANFLGVMMAEKVFEDLEPKALVVTNLGNFQTAFIYSAHKHNIRVVEVQHAVISSYSSYLYTDKKMKKALPDITCVYGMKAYEQLTKKSIYDENEVAVTGSPRYDVLFNLKNLYSKEAFKKKYGITPDKKIVLWTTQTQGLKWEENRRNCQAVFTAMKNLGNAVLVIKQHPGEKKRHTKFIKKEARKYRCENVVFVPANSDTYEAIFSCDLMITRHSTTGLEAVAMGKPVILLNLSGEADGVDYVEEGVAKGVYSGEDLKPAIEKLLKDDSELAANRERYIEQELYRIDGKATERVAALIEKILSDHPS